MNESFFRVRTRTIAKERGLDLDAPENRYSLWSYDGLSPWFVGAFGTPAEAVAAGRKSATTSLLYVLAGSAGRLAPLDVIAGEC
jgi:hypothetical protein